MIVIIEKALSSHHLFLSWWWKKNNCISSVCIFSTCCCSNNVCTEASSSGSCNNTLPAAWLQSSCVRKPWWSNEFICPGTADFYGFCLIYDIMPVQKELELCSLAALWVLVAWWISLTIKTYCGLGGSVYTHTSLQKPYETTYWSSFFVNFTQKKTLCY